MLVNRIIKLPFEHRDNYLFGVEVWIQYLKKWSCKKSVKKLQIKFEVWSKMENCSQVKITTGKKVLRNAGCRSIIFERSHQHPWNPGLCGNQKKRQGIYICSLSSSIISDPLRQIIEEDKEGLIQLYEAQKDIELASLWAAAEYRTIADLEKMKLSLQKMELWDYLMTYNFILPLHIPVTIFSRAISLRIYLIFPMNIFNMLWASWQVKKQTLWFFWNNTRMCLPPSKDRTLQQHEIWWQTICPGLSKNGRFS